MNRSPSIVTCIRQWLLAVTTSAGTFQRTRAARRFTSKPSDVSTW